MRLIFREVVFVIVASLAVPVISGTALAGLLTYLVERSIRCCN